jgi:hypothetical protein
MDELVKRVSEQTGLPEEMAKSAAETVIDYLKDKLPAPIAGQIDGVLGGSGGAGLGDLTKGLGGMLGGKQPRSTLQLGRLNRPGGR